MREERRLQHDADDDDETRGGCGGSRDRRRWVLQHLDELSESRSTIGRSCACSGGGGGRRRRRADDGADREPGSGTATRRSPVGGGERHPSPASALPYPVAGRPRTCGSFCPARRSAVLGRSGRIDELHAHSEVARRRCATRWSATWTPTTLCRRAPPPRVADDHCHVLRDAVVAARSIWKLRSKLPVEPSTTLRGHAVVVGDVGKVERALRAPWRVGDRRLGPPRSRSSVPRSVSAAARSRSCSSSARPRPSKKSVTG